MSGLSVIFRRTSDSALIPPVWANESVFGEYISKCRVLASGFSYTASDVGDDGQWQKYSTPSGGLIAVSMEGHKLAARSTSMSIERYTDAIYDEIALVFAAYHRYGVDRYEVETKNSPHGSFTTIIVYTQNKWYDADTYSWCKSGAGVVEIKGTAVHGRTRISIVGNDIYFFGNYADGYNEEEDDPIVYTYNCFGERFTSEGFTRLTEKVVLCSGIEKIGAHAFYNCANLQKIIIPESVTEIDRTSFEECTNLTIHTRTGSYAEKYARENGITVVSYTNSGEELLKRLKKRFNKDSVLADVTEVSLSYGRKSISYELKTGKLSYRNTTSPHLVWQRFPDGYFDEKTILLDAHKQERCKKLLEKHLRKLPFEEKLNKLPPGASHGAVLCLDLKDGGKLYYANTHYCCGSGRVESKPVQKGFLRLCNFFAGFCEFQEGVNFL